MKTALILVDIQNDYFPGGANTLREQEKAAANARTVLARFRIANNPVIHVRHVNTRPGATFFLPDTAGAEIHESVRPTAGESVITKNFPDSFLQTTLQETLEKLDTNQLVICGMMSHMCIDATVRSAKAKGYEITVPHDACTTRDLEWNGEILPAHAVHKAFMAALNGAFAQMTTAESLLQ